jgi:hypothetical protein
MRKQWTIGRFLLLALLVRAFAPLWGELSAPSPLPFDVEICSAGHAFGQQGHPANDSPGSSPAAGDHCLLCGGVGMVPPTAEIRFAVRSLAAVSGEATVVARPRPVAYAGFQFLANAPPFA